MPVPDSRETRCTSITQWPGTSWILLRERQQWKTLYYYCCVMWTDRGERYEKKNPNSKETRETLGIPLRMKKPQVCVLMLLFLSHRHIYYNVLQYKGTRPYYIHHYDILLLLLYNGIDNRFDSYPVRLYRSVGSIILYLLKIVVSPIQRAIGRVKDINPFVIFNSTHNYRERWTFGFRYATITTSIPDIQSSSVFTYWFIDPRGRQFAADHSRRLRVTTIVRAT